MNEELKKCPCCGGKASNRQDYLALAERRKK